MIGLGGSDSTKYAYMADALMENRLKEDKIKKRIGGGLLSSNNLIYFVFLLVNVIGYIIVMPK